jgi:hypothetical protein
MTITIKRTNEPDKIIFGEDITKDNWKDIVIEKIVGKEDLEYERKNGYDVYECQNGVTFWCKNNVIEFDWLGNDLGIAELTDD